MKRPKVTRKQLQRRLGLTPLVNRVVALLDRRPGLQSRDSSFMARQREEYLEIRDASYRLVNEKILPSLPKEAFHFAGSNLGMLSHNVLCFQTESESAVLMDHAIYNYRAEGQTILQRYAESHDGELSALERKWLSSAAKSRHTLVLVTETIPDLGLVGHDVFRDEKLLIIDLNFSRSPATGLTLATRLIPIDDFYMNSGGTLPVVSQSAFFEIGEYLQRMQIELKAIKDLSPDRATLLESFIIRTLLNENSSERIEFAKP